MKTKFISRQKGHKGCLGELHTLAGTKATITVHHTVKWNQDSEKLNKTIRTI